MMIIIITVILLYVIYTVHKYTLVPDPPTGLKVIPRYSYASGQFSGMTFEFNTERVNFSPLCHVIIQC